MTRRLPAVCTMLIIVFLQVAPVLASPWSDYKTQVDSIVLSTDLLNAQVRAIHINYTEGLISPEEAVSRMKLLGPKYQEIKGKAETLKPPARWEKYHETFLQIIGLTVDSTEELRHYFESGNQEDLRKSLSTIHQAVEEFQHLSTQLPMDEDPPKMLNLQSNPTNPGSGQPVEVTVNATDLQTGVGRVVLNYSVNDGDWTTKGIQLVSGSDGNGVWTGSIPGQAAGSRVTYYVVVTDKSGNIAKSEAHDYSLTDLSIFIPVVIAGIIVAMFVLVRLRTRRKGKTLQELTGTEEDVSSVGFSGQPSDEASYSPDQNKESA